MRTSSDGPGTWLGLQLTGTLQEPPARLVQAIVLALQGMIKKRVMKLTKGKMPDIFVFFIRDESLFYIAIQVFASERAKRLIVMALEKALKLDDIPITLMLSFDTIAHSRSCVSPSISRASEQPPCHSHYCE
jgi:hypothetical protein